MVILLLRMHLGVESMLAHWQKSRHAALAAMQHRHTLLLCAGDQAAGAAGSDGGPGQAVQQSGGVLPAAGALLQSHSGLPACPAGTAVTRTTLCGVLNPVHICCRAGCLLCCALLLTSAPPPPGVHFLSLSSSLVPGRSST